MNKDYNDARRMLVALLQHPDDGPVVGIDTFSVAEQDFMITTCAATVMLHAICYVANGDAEKAIEGLASLTLDKKLEQICEDGP